jgi:hypothetical protein
MLSDQQMEKHAIANSAGVYSFSAQLLEELLPGTEPQTALNFLTDLQTAHDEASSVSFVQNFIRRANQVAVSYGLNPISSTELVK